MRTDAELERYKSQIEKEHNEYKTLSVGRDKECFNGSNTSDRKAPNGYSWIDFWRAMSDNHKTVLECSSCGKMIFVEKVPPVMVKMYQLMKLDEKIHIAHGGHIALDGSGKELYITPLCPECNSLSGKITIRRGSILCREIRVD